MKDQPKVSVIDAICGAGKTSYAIQMMNERVVEGFGDTEELEEKFLFVTPYNNEIKRVRKSCNFPIYTPEPLFGSKLKGAKKLIREGKSIVMTHKLFSMFDEDTLMDIETEGYILIMDEVANVLNHVNISKDDVNWLVDNRAINIDNEGKVEWIKEDYGNSEENLFSHIKILAETENLYIENNSFMFWTMNVKAFTSFKEVFILTYLFDGQIQKYYYDMFNLEYDKLTVKNKDDKYYLDDYRNKEENREYISELLNVYEDSFKGNSKTKKTGLNSNFIKQKNKKDDYVLSSSWFSKATDEEILQLKKNLKNYFQNINNTPNSKLYWTTKKNYAEKLKTPKTKINKNDDRSKDNFLPFSTRATNDYRECYSTAFLYNRFMNPMEKSFFHTRGVKVNEDMLAQSDLIQFLFRGCIREGKEMNCYIPSSRMRNLLYDWMEYN